MKENAYRYRDSCTHRNPNKGKPENIIYNQNICKFFFLKKMPKQSLMRPKPFQNIIEFAVC